MLIEQKTMDDIHEVQLEMWKVLSSLLDNMEIPYFFVHGSLLGTIRDGSFIKEDDDIDIAIFRKDYERLMSNGNDNLPNYYFLQNCINDDFPLAFGKFRDSRTAFIQPVLDNYACNKGIYIDIFPIDYVPESKWREYIYNFRVKVLNSRIFLRMHQGNRSLTQLIARVLYPSYEKTVKKREAIYKELPRSQFVSITGGKTKEKRIPLEWFNTSIEMQFCGTSVSCPINYSDYLKHIYGDDILDYNPAQKRIVNNQIEISAEILDFNKSYKEY